MRPLPSLLVRSLPIAVPLALPILALLFAAGPAQAGDDCHPHRFPPVIDLPKGFQPEGITDVHGQLLVTSIRTGGIYRVDPRSGAGSLLVAGQPGRSSVGIKHDPRTNWLFVAGGATGHAVIYDADTGALVADYSLASAPTFINDVVITRDAAYFTESSAPVFYKLPLRRGGRLPDPGQVVTIPITGDHQFVAGQYNDNGIVLSPQGELIIVNAFVGALYRVDPSSGAARTVDLGGASVKNGDGLVLQGRTLYVVQNFSNQVSVIKLSRRFDRGEVVDVITNPNFDIPATATLLHDALYVTNGRFDIPPTDDTPYTVVRVPVDE